MGAFRSVRPVLTPASPMRSLCSSARGYSSTAITSVMFQNQGDPKHAGQGSRPAGKLCACVRERDYGKHTKPLRCIGPLTQNSRFLEAGPAQQVRCSLPPAQTQHLLRIYGAAFPPLASRLQIQLPVPGEAAGLSTAPRGLTTGLWILWNRSCS